MQRVKGALKPFGELKNGDAFLHKGFLLMKIQPIIDRDGDTWNAVDLENGREYCFRDRTVIEAVVAIVKAELMDSIREIDKWIQERKKRRNEKDDTDN